MTRMSPSRFMSATRLARSLTLALAMVALMSGCVSQGQHDNLMTKDRRVNEQLVELQDQLNAKDSLIASLQARLAAGPDTVQDPALLDALNKVKLERDSLSAALALAEANIIRLSRQKQPVGTLLPGALDAKLKALAAANPGLLEYDAKRGMIRIRSDLTFALGSIEIKKAGVDALRQLAAIVNSPEASPFDVRVVGHTDNVPVANPTNKRRFGDNWGLSAFRSIAVGSVLTQSGLQATRLEVAGRGEYQPIVANGARGAEANRRVDIFLVNTNRSVAVAPAGAGNAAVVVPERVEEDNPESFK